MPAEDILEEILDKWSSIIQNQGNCSLDYIVWQATLTILSVLENYRDYLTKADIHMGEYMYQLTSDLIDTYNKVTRKEHRLRYKSLLPIQIAYLIKFLYFVRRIPCAGERGEKDLDMLAVYQTSGSDEGLYDDSNTTLNEIIRMLKSTITTGEISEVRQALRDIVPRADRTVNRDFIPVNNGILDYKMKTLLPFGPEYVLLAKSRINYNPLAQNVVIHNPDGTDWDVESWMKSLSDDPEVVNLLWEVLGAVLRPFVRWRKCAIFYANKGNNGKGTLCELARNLCGEGRYTSVPFNSFAEDFSLEDLTNSIAIISDENDVGCYLKKAANLKAVITNDVVQINRKNKKKIPFQFFGFMIQCFNDFPRIKDKSDSFYRRCLFIPFSKCFTGVEREYIKDDYLKRPEVLEYIMYRVLNMDYYRLSEPAVCHSLLDDYKVYNNPTRQWWEEVSGSFVWDLLPWTFLYQLYHTWFKENNPSGNVASSRTFINELRQIVENDDTWTCPTTTDKPGKRLDKQISASGRIIGDEPLGKSVGWDWGRPDRWQAGKHRGLLRRVPRLQAQSQVPSAQNPANSNPYGNSSVGPSYDAVSAAR